MAAKGDLALVPVGIGKFHGKNGNQTTIKQMLRFCQTSLCGPYHDIFRGAMMRWWQQAAVVIQLDIICG
jgi:hypothetical protein